MALIRVKKKGYFLVLLSLLVWCLPAHASDLAACLLGEKWESQDGQNNDQDEDYDQCNDCLIDDQHDECDAYLLCNYKSQRIQEHIQARLKKKAEECFYDQAIVKEVVDVIFKKVIFRFSEEKEEKSESFQKKMLLFLLGYDPFIAKKKSNKDIDGISQDVRQNSNKFFCEGDFFLEMDPHCVDYSEGFEYSDVSGYFNRADVSKCVQFFDKVFKEIFT
jgi:hypothetical protein